MLSEKGSYRPAKVTCSTPGKTWTNRTSALYCSNANSSTSNRWTSSTTIWSFVHKVWGMGPKMAVMQVSVGIHCGVCERTDYDPVFNPDNLFIWQISILLSLSWLRANLKCQMSIDLLWTLSATHWSKKAKLASWFSREGKEADLGSTVPRGSSISDCRHRRHSSRYSQRGSSKLNWTPMRFLQPLKTLKTAQQYQWFRPRPKSARCLSWLPSRTMTRQFSSSKTMLSLVDKNPHLYSFLSRCYQHWTQVARSC